MQREEREKCDRLKTQEAEISSFDREKLDRYFEAFELKADMTVTTTDPLQEEVQLAKHKIKWLDTDAETKIRIDDDLFTLKDKTTLNKVWASNDTVDNANHWDEMKLYNLNGRELIGISMSFQNCTGLGCSVNYFLIYDVQTKRKNFFGTFRHDGRLALYNFDNDDKIDYLSKTFNGDAHGSTPMEFIYELYSLKKNGSLVQQKDKMGNAYHITQTTFPNDTTKEETFEQRWVAEIK